MPKHQWRIRLRPHLTDEQKAMSPYAIADELGMSRNTARRYLENDEVVISQLNPVVSILAEYFGINVFDIVAVVTEDDEAQDEDESQGQIKAAQLA